MTDETVSQDGAHDPALEVAHRIVDRIVGIVTIIVVLAFVLLAGLVAVYVWFTVNPAADTNASVVAAQVLTLLTTLWGQLVPLATSVVRIVAPVLIILVAMILLRALSRRSATPLDLRRITSDLPSVLALVIIATICVLPLSGLAVPDVLSNVALVVVGFYFGKRDLPSAGGGS